LNEEKRKLGKKTASLNELMKNKEKLKVDVKKRRKRFKTFQKHIMQLTNSTFDEMLNKKGSSGEIIFSKPKKVMDNEGKTRNVPGTLGLTVQKDNNDEMSQTSDIKALSGGERSYTTIALLLALGENLEVSERAL
tara:strand:- start:374 stop:778 length:405 start_codon:yes stop_codon:yes gene_type:complete